MNGMSLSIVFGTPDDRDPQLALGDHLGDRQRAAQRAVAADDEQDVDAQLLQAVDDLLRVLLPREVPRIVPPSSLMSRTTSGVEVDHRLPVPGDEPLVAVAEARDPVHAVVAVSSITSARITSLRPGHSPPQVTIPTRVFDGSKKILRRGPPASNPGSSRPPRRARGPSQRCRRAAPGRSRRPNDANCAGDRAARPAASLGGTVRAS